ncbi:hypothetical protein PMAYCL1PPCAC_29891, partial [Pristionchus mayeri]
LPLPPFLFLALLHPSNAFFFGNYGCGCQLPPPPPLPVLDSCACRKEERDQPVFREPPTLPFLPLQQSSIYYAPPPAASPTYYSAPGPVIAREYIPVSSYRTSPVGFQSGHPSGTFPVSQSESPWSRRHQFAFHRSNEDRLTRYRTSSYSLPPLNPSLPPPIVLPPVWPSLPPPPTPPPVRPTPPPSDWPEWTTRKESIVEPPPPPPPPPTQPPNDPYRPWNPTPPPSDWTTQPPPPPPPPPPSNPYKPWTTTPPPSDWATPSPPPSWLLTLARPPPPP